MADPDLDRIKRNIGRMIDQNAPETDIDAYLKTVGHTPDSFRAAVKPGAPPSEKAETPGLVDSTARGLAKGASFNLADELAAAGNAAVQPIAGFINRNLPDNLATLGPALIPLSGTILAARESGRSSQAPNFSDRYSENLRRERGVDAQFRKENPLLSIGSEVGGNIAGTFAALPASMLKVPAGLLQMMKQGAVVGGTTSALSGFGEGEGGFQNRMLNAAIHGGIGTVAGGTLPAAIYPAAKTASWVKNTIGLQNPGKMATAKAVQAFERDAVPLPAAADELTRLLAAGKPATVMDVGGENVRGLTQAAAGMPGPAKQRAVQVLEARQGTMGAPPGSGQAGRVVADAEKALGVQSGNFGRTVDDLIEEADRASTPLYDKFRAFGPLVSDKLDEFAGNPVVKDAMREGVRIAQARGADLKGLGVTGFNDAGDPQFGKILTAEGWDYAKRGLDDMIEAAQRGGKKTLAGAYIDLKRRIVGEVDDLTEGTYKAARGAFAGPLAMRDAMQLGRDVLKEEGGYQIAKQVKALGESEKRAFLQGVVEAIRDKAMGTADGGNAVRAIMSKPILREKLMAAFPDEASYAAFLRNMVDEAKLFSNAATVSPKSGSLTDTRAAARADMRGDMIGDATSAMLTGQSPVNALLRFGRVAQQRAGGLNTPTANSLTELMLSGDPAIIQALQAAQARGTPIGRAARYIGPTAGATTSQTRR